MRALEIERAGTPVLPNVRFTRDRAEPTPAAGEALVRTEASALNHLDLWVGRGLPGVKTSWPFVSGSDGAGIVAAVGAGVDPSWVGRRVLLNAAVQRRHDERPDSIAAGEQIEMIGEHRPGTHAELFTAPVSNLLDIGDLDPVEAAAFGLTHLTAWRMLITRGNAKPGEFVLIPGIGGGVALAAHGIAKWLGCVTIVSSRSAGKLARAKELGADHAILDTGTDWSKEVRSLTNRRGVELCIDSVGAAIHPQCLRCLCRGGRFVTCGATSGGDAVTDLTRVFWNQLSILGSTMGSMSEFRAVVALLRAGAVRPVIDQVSPAERGATAFGRLERGDHFGKVVVDWRASGRRG